MGTFAPSRTAYAHEAPPIAPARLEFDARNAPKLCNDEAAFKFILTNWVPREKLSTDADRKLVVRISRTPRGAKLGDVSLLDAAGTTLSEEHQTFGAKIECHKVLFDVAYSAANLLGAFEKPPAPEPIVCPTCPACVEPTPCPVMPPQPSGIASITHVARPQTASTPPRRVFLGAGVFIGTGIASQAAIGPLFSFGFVPSLHSSRVHVELTGAWAPQSAPQWQAQAIPLSGSLCYSRDVFRFCSGLTSTFLERRDSHAAMKDLSIMLAGTLRAGTEFDVAGPFSIRIDVSTSVRFWEQTFGQGLAAIPHSDSFAAAIAATGMWSFE